MFRRYCYLLRGEGTLTTTYAHSEGRCSLAKGGFLDKLKEMLGGAAGGDKAKQLIEDAAEKIDKATEASGGALKQAGDLIGANKEKIADAATDLSDKFAGGGGGSK